MFKSDAVDGTAETLSIINSDDADKKNKSELTNKVGRLARPYRDLTAVRHFFASER